MKKIIILITLIMIPLISASDFGYNNLEKPGLITTVINYTKVNVNSSQFWDELNTPSDILISQVSNDLNLVNSTYVLSINTTTNIQNLLNGTNMYFKNLGIGIESPEVKLHILTESNETSDRVNALIVEAKQSENNPLTGFGPSIMFKDPVVSVSEMGEIAGVYEDDGQGSSGLVFWTNDGSGLNESLRISSNGKVGIGTKSPSEKLEVNGSLELSGNGNEILGWEGYDSGFAVNRIYTEGPYAFLIDADNNDASSYFAIGHDSSAIGTMTELMRVQENGKVGIGTKSPSEKLEVNGSVELSEGNDKLIWQGYTSGVAVNRVYSQGPYAFLIDADNNDASSYFAIGHDSSAIGSMTELMRIQENGRVGIGTTAPSFPLHVIGNVSTVSIFSDGNISATGFITRTHTFDKSKNVWDYIKDADYYIDNEEINHSKFYGYTSFEMIDYSKPIVEKCEDIGGVSDCIKYPYNKTEEGVILEKEIELLRQSIYELKMELCLMGRIKFC